MARKPRNYQAEYAARVARAQAAGKSSYYALRKERESAKAAAREALDGLSAAKDRVEAGDSVFSPTVGGGGGGGGGGADFEDYGDTGPSVDRGSYDDYREAVAEGEDLTREELIELLHLAWLDDDYEFLDMLHEQPEYDDDIHYH